MTPRRDWLKNAAALGAAAGSGLLLPQATAQATEKPAERPTVKPDSKASNKSRAWQNWSGIQQCQPGRWLTPANEAELAAALPGAPAPLRAVGAGHSFTALVPTEGTLISLDRLSGAPSIDKQNLTVRVGAGMRIGALARALDSQGYALYNQPDIDVQTLAGALSTGTHGTGQTLPALHAEVQALRLVSPEGRVHECSRAKNPDLFDAARVSLGALGVISEYTLRIRPRFMLRRHVWLERTEALLERAPELAATHRHFELYVLPFTGYSAGITHIEADTATPQPPDAGDESVLRDLRHLRDWFGRWPALRRWAAARLINPEQTESAFDWSWRLLSTSRPTRFNESEYHLPRETGVAALREVLATLEKRNEVFFPMEFRYIRADHAWLSPFYERDSCSVAAHALQGEDHAYLISELGPVFRKHGGRPHWGKLHDLKQAQLQALYPRFADFQKLRRELDPQGRMLNAHLAQLFGAPRG
jgi:FAD-linked oxidoreductase